MPSHRAAVAFVTAGTEQSAVAIARVLVAEGLAACANLLPVRSIYRWKENIEDEAEYLLIIKTRANRFGQLERRVRELHSYEVPEVISVTIDAGSKPYLDWLLGSTSSASGGRRTSTSAGRARVKRRR